MEDGKSIRGWQAVLTFVASIAVLAAAAETNGSGWQEALTEIVPYALSLVIALTVAFWDWIFDRGDCEYCGSSEYPWCCDEARDDIFL